MAAFQTLRASSYVGSPASTTSPCSAAAEVGDRGVRGLGHGVPPWGRVVSRLVAGAPRTSASDLWGAMHCSPAGPRAQPSRHAGKTLWSDPDVPADDLPAEGELGQRRQVPGVDGAPEHVARAGRNRLTSWPTARAAIPLPRHEGSRHSSATQKPLIPWASSLVAATTPAEAPSTSTSKRSACAAHSASESASSGVAQRRVVSGCWE